MRKVLLTLALLTAISTSYAYEGNGCRESDHIICKQFGLWTVRHYFDSETLRYRFSDANTPLVLVDKQGDKLEVNFQINVSADGAKTIRIPGWITAIEIAADQFKFTRSGSQNLHEMIEEADSDLLDAFANAKSKIQVRLTFDQPSGIKEFAKREGRETEFTYVGTLDNRQSARALIWIRAIYRKK